MPRVDANVTHGPSEPRRILAVSPGGRVTGVAAIDGPSGLRRFDTIGARAEHEPRRKADAFESRLARVLAEERPDFLVVEAIDERRRTPFTDALATAATRLAREKGIPHALFPLADARRLLARSSPTRVSTHRALAARFPQIAACTRQPLHSKWYGYADQYWERSFAALTLALAWAESHGQKPS